MHGQKNIKLCFGEFWPLGGQMM